jgi:predicted nucleotidyltransferase/shikimate kinase
MKSFLEYKQTPPIDVEEGPNDPAIFKAIFLAGGPGSGKSFISGKTGLPILGFKVINSDISFEKAMKDAALEMNPENIFSVTGQAMRAKAKKMTDVKKKIVLKGRLGLCIDGTGRDYLKLKNQAVELKSLGYDVGMIFVNTDLDTALERNRNRERTLPEPAVVTMWKDVQTNIGRFQSLFKDNFIVVDNSSGSNWQKATTKGFKFAQRFANKPVRHVKAIKWLGQFRSGQMEGCMDLEDIKLVESIIDIPRRTYAPAVFDNEESDNPKIKPSVKELINNQLKEFETEYPIVKTSLIGSILTKRYRNDADLDINVLFDVPPEKAEAERERLSKKYLSSSNPDNIQGKLIPGTEHPINYYFITSEGIYDEQNGKADAVFDIETDTFIKRPEDFVFDPDLYMHEFDRKVQELDIIKGELKRDIIDYKELTELQPSDIIDLQDKIEDKLKEVETGIQDYVRVGDLVDKERRAAFDTDMTPEQIKTFSIKNRLPKNVVYKMLEKYHYLKFYKMCKKILDDGKVDDAEITKLQTEATFAAPNRAIIDNILTRVSEKLEKDLKRGNYKDLNDIAKLVKNRVEKDTKHKGFSRMKDQK